MTPTDSEYLKLWRRMDKVVIDLTETAHKFNGRAAKRYRKAKSDLIEYADYLMVNFFCYMGEGIEELEWLVEDAERYSADAINDCNMLLAKRGE